MIENILREQCVFMAFLRAVLNVRFTCRILKGCRSRKHQLILQRNCLFYFSNIIVTACDTVAHRRRCPVLSYHSVGGRSVAIQASAIRCRQAPRSCRKAEAQLDLTQAISKYNPLPESRRSLTSSRSMSRGYYSHPECGDLPHCIW